NFNPGSRYDVEGSSNFNLAFQSITTFDGTVVSVGSAINIFGATVIFNQDVSTTTLSLAGVLAGSGAVTVSGPITWSGGSMGGTGFTNADGGLVMSGALSVTGTRTFNNASVATYNGTDRSFNLDPGAVFNNLPTGSLTVDGNNDFGGGTINNQGTFLKLPGATGDGVTFFGF